MHKAINEHITAIDDMIGTFYADGRRSFFCVAAEGVHKSTIAHGTTEVMLSAVGGSLGEVIADAAESDEGLEEILDAVTDVIRICAREAWEKLGEGGGMIQ
jgi:hypothetical protein